MGELLSVSEAEGEYLEAFGCFSRSPFRLLIAFAATFPISWGQLLVGDSTKRLFPSVTTYNFTVLTNFISYN